MVLDCITLISHFQDTIYGSLSGGAAGALGRSSISHPSLLILRTFRILIPNPLEPTVRCCNQFHSPTSPPTTTHLAPEFRPICNPEHA
jgi:hypothetical protein